MAALEVEVENQQLTVEVVIVDFAEELQRYEVGLEEAEEQAQLVNVAGREVMDQSLEAQRLPWTVEVDRRVSAVAERTDFVVAVE